MATGLAPAVVQSMLDELCRGVDWTPPAGFYLKLHTGDPGVAGANNAFGDTTRKSVTFSAAAADGTITNSASVDWTNVSAAGTVTHVSFWSTVGPAGGTFLGSDDLATSRTLAIGDNFTINAGDVDLSLAPLAA